MSLVVIVDDQPTNRQIFTRIAASIEEGTEVKAFADPRPALEWLGNNTPDLLITDYNMPHMDGAEFISAMRRIPALVDVPVIVITVFEDRAYRIAALDAGATDFLQSPVDHREFVTRARNLLKLRQQQLLLADRANNLERELEVSEQELARTIRDSRDQLAQVIDTVPALISATDCDGKFLFVNAYHSKVTGLDPARVVGHDSSEVLGEEAASRNKALDRMVLTSGKPLNSYEEELNDAQGKRRVFLTTKSPLKDQSNAITGILTSSLDITDRKAAENHLQHIARHDALTGLPNRTLIRDQLRKEIARARRGDRKVGLQMLDIDRFKSVNDALGHSVGDRLLKAIAQRLRVTVREGDMVARLGGDEFAILMSDVQGPSETTQLAEKIIDVIGQPLFFEGHEINPTASIGISMHPDDGGDVDSLMKSADLAMYRAKSHGGNGYEFASAGMADRARDAIVLEADLRRALQREEFRLFYQPQVDLATGEVVGAEALLRWQHPIKGLISPGVFLPLAEQNGQIVPINEWVMREACRQAMAWTDEGLPPLRIAVNLSPVQFRKQNMRALVVELLETSGLPAERLDLELTENILMENSDVVTEDLLYLQKLGVGFSIDDFGTGYSSLGYIKRFPVARLKIDQGFIRNLETDPNDAAIIKAIIGLGKSLNLSVTAEGVETEEQADFLRKEGCNEVQGYYFGRPQPSETFVELFRPKARLVYSA
ncbi:EAL domain-containing protein [Breoghania sp.]|uniref:GGDEF/EAL domain-containing response regulator n=1 Tax=Breoghania sp. TaxID=2065378 RepID=UPI0029C9D03A|nr:EAL domain-containing protein [Breoghania sp.]